MKNPTTTGLSDGGNEGGNHPTATSTDDIASAHTRAIIEAAEVHRLHAAGLATDAEKAAADRALDQASRAFFNATAEAGHQSAPTTKLAAVRAAAAAGDWSGALRIAARFQDLGEHAAAIKRAHEATWNPSWSRQLGRDPQVDIDAGIEALRQRYKIRATNSIPPEGQDQ